MSVSPPVLRFPEPVRRDLEAHRRGLADELERTMAAHVRPCVAITSRRVSATPLRRGAIARILGRSGAEPVLGIAASKFGGTPYCDPDEDWRHHAFLGQIDLAEATAVLPPDAPRLTGLLRLDVSDDGSPDELVRARWFPEIDARRAPSARPRSFGAWETRLEFALAWTLPEGRALEELWPLDEPRWHDYDAFYPAGYNTDASDEYHRLLGHRSGALDEHYGFTPPVGLDEDISHYESLLRVTYDPRADFGWGTNWIYLLVPREDLLRGELGRLVVTGANA